LVTIGKNYKILLMEDNLDLGDTLKEMLEDEGYDIVWVKDGIEASEITYADKFDLYVFDINVPNFNGLELLDALRNAEDTTPTIFISALIDMETIKKAFNIGVDDYIKKPFFPEELLVRIQSRFKTINKDIYYKDICYNPKTQIIFKANRELFLGKKQKKLLHILLINLDKTIDINDIKEFCEIKTSSSLRVALGKLKQDTEIEVRNIHGVGYRVETR